MPNLIHSLDAASLCLLFEQFSKNNKNEKFNFYGVHDCYATSADKAVQLNIILKSIYTQIYSDNDYIRQFDD